MSQASAFEVIVAGGGVVGATTALALAQAGVCVALVDAAPLPQGDAPFDGRASALAAGPFRIFSALGLEAALTAQAQPIARMVVTDGDAPGAAAAPFDTPALVFDAAEAGDDGPLGWMMENRRLRAALTVGLLEAGVVVFAPARVSGLAVEGGHAVLTLQDGRRLTAEVVVGAEGRESAVRKTAGIGVSGWAYGRSGVVATVRLEQPHGGVAYQHFLPAGPLAVLPLPPDETGRDRASLVWSERPDEAQALAAMADDAFAALLIRRFGDILGAVEPVGPRFAHPLGLQLADSLVGARVALVGDAAQAIHPLAGQGLNLGLKDAAALAETLVEARRLGEDIGSEAVLARYARWRRFDRMSFAAGTDAFHRLYGAQFPGARLLRGMGVAAVNAASPLKRWLTREAAGVAGEPPRLLQGRPL
jgi:2-octaprenyl-6-methoxyphenol hydroxylase